MAFDNVGFKAAARALFASNKACTADNASLAQHHTKMPSGIIAKAKSKFKQHYYKTTFTFHRHADVEPNTTVVYTSDFTIPPIEFAPTDLSVTTEEAPDTLQHTIAVDSESTLWTNGAKSSITAVESSATGSASIVNFTSTASFLIEIDDFEDEPLTGSASSTQTALSIHLAAAVPIRNLTKPTTLELKPAAEEVTERITQLESPSVAVPESSPSNIEPDDISKPSQTMATEAPKAKKQKLGGVLHKLKAKLWPWCNNKGSEIEIEEEEEVNLSDRCQWDIVTNIEPTTIIDVLRSVLTTCAYGGRRFQNTAMKVISTAQGSYHLVFMVKAINPYSLKLEDWVVKIPGHGTPDRWTAEDEYMLTQEVQTLDLITMYTEVPAPLVFGHSATLNNKFGFPYIVMKKLPGTSATELWYEEHTETPSPETEQKRLTFLRSLAGHMTELDKLRFDQIGMPLYNPHAEDFENIDDIEAERMAVGKYHAWPYCDTYDSVERGPFASTQAYISNARDEYELRPLDKDSPHYESQLEAHGTSAILDIVFSHTVFKSTPQDTFALRHSDLDTQNILIDDSGNITGILDWDASLSMPRAIAHASVPAFLDRDFHPSSITKSPFLCWRAAHYRSMYAALLLEAGNPDAIYTTKSHMYAAGFAALYEGGDAEDFVERILKEVPGLQVEAGAIKFLLAKGCKATREMLELQLGKVLEPELPPAGVLDEVEKQHKEAAVKAWMDGFEGYLFKGVDGM